MNEISPSMESERRLVTVMFADISGFTTMSEKMDPEEVADIMTECFSLMEECIEKHGGTIDKFIGDSVMALFGVPKALEDAPHRAIDTAIEIMGKFEQINGHKNLSMPLGIHVGINTGPVVAGMLGGQKKQDFTVMGDTVNLASRLVNTAEFGTILVAESTYGLTQGYFEFEPLGEMQVKGKEHPVMAYRVIGPCQVKTRIDACLAKGLTPFVGRNREIAHLMDCFEEVKEGRGQVVGVVGEPGVGKTRLVCEFIELLPAGAFTSLEGGCLHYGDTIPYLPILDILKAYFQVHEDDSEAVVKEKIRCRISSFGDLCGAIVSPIHEVLSLPVDDPVYEKLEPRQRREKVFEAIKMFLTLESQKNPLIVVVEDLHWIDKTSEEFLIYFINALANTPVMLILLYRPEYTPGWVGKSYYSQVRVSQLSQRASEDLVKAILTEGEVVSELSGLVVERAAGNPLFIEELTHSLMENGTIEKRDNRYILARTASHVQVPATIQGIIASRLDRLEGTLKRIMQVASVIGREFAFRILQAVASLKEDIKTSLLTLQDLEFIYEKSLFPELEYIFKHALTQEVAYNSLLIKKRKEIHEQVGHAIEEIYGDRLEEFYEMLAYHFSMSENTDKAYTYLKRSADKAARKYSNWESIRLYTEAIRLLDSMPATQERNVKKLDVCLSILVPMFFVSYGDEVLEILNTAETLAQVLKDERSLIIVYERLAHYYGVKGNIILGMEYAEKCFYMGDKLGTIEMMAQSAADVCMNNWILGNFKKQTHIARRALQLLEVNHREEDFMGRWITVYSSLSGWCGCALSFLGCFVEGKEMLDKALYHAHHINDDFGIGFLEVSYAILLFMEGDGKGTIEHSQTAIQYFQKTQGKLLYGVAQGLLGCGHYLRGEYEEAKDLIMKGITEEKGLVPPALPLMYSNLSLVYAASGNWESSVECADQALKLSREFNTKAFEGFALVILGRMRSQMRNTLIRDALDIILQGISVLEELSAEAISAIGYLFAGELLGFSGKKEEALEYLNKTVDMYREMGVEPHYYWPSRVQAALERAKKM